MQQSNFVEENEMHNWLCNPLLLDQEFGVYRVKMQSFHSNAKKGK